MNQRQLPHIIKASTNIILKPLQINALLMDSSICKANNQSANDHQAIADNLSQDSITSMPSHPPGFPANYLTNSQQTIIPNTYYNSNDAPMVHKTIHPTDNTDIWGTLHVSIPTNYQHPAVHLQAQIMMQQIPIQDAEHINTDTTAITAYPRNIRFPCATYLAIALPQYQDTQGCRNPSQW